MDDTNIKWPHGSKVNKFFEPLKNLYEEIMFTNKREKNGSISLLYVVVTRNKHESLNHKIFMKETQTKSYLQVGSHHHPTQKTRVLNTLSIRDIIYVR